MSGHATRAIGSVAAALAAQPRRGRAAIGRPHRLDDVGDDWRALLTGAPPAVL